MCVVRAGSPHHRRCRALSVALTLALFALVPLAEASPPDPLWIAGIYDEIDFDQGIEAAVSTIAEIRIPLQLSVRTDTLRGLVSFPETTLVPVATFSAFPIRAPPVALPPLSSWIDH